MKESDHDIDESTPDEESNEKIGLEYIVFGIANLILSGALSYLFYKFYIQAENMFQQVGCAFVIVINAANFFRILFAFSYRLITIMRSKLR